jgi:hypothetical protein
MGGWESFGAAARSFAMAASTTGLARRRAFPGTRDPQPREPLLGSIDIKATGPRYRFTTTDLDFAGLSLPAGLRISGPAGTTAATDIEPEYVSILGKYAYVTLQENNGVAKVNLATNSIGKIFALGTVDYSNLPVDLSDRDGPLDAQGRPTSTFAPKLGQPCEGSGDAGGRHARW